MGQAYFLKHKRYRQFASIFLFLLWGYLSFHLFVSERSVTSLMTLSAQEQSLSVQLSDIQSEKALLEDHVVRLRPQSLDLDLLEEQAMVMLGHVRDNSVIILDDNG